LIKLSWSYWTYPKCFLDGYPHPPPHQKGNIKGLFVKDFGFNLKYNFQHITQ